MKKIVVIIGPTASGKTNLAIELAKRCNGEMLQHLEPFCSTLYVDTYAQDYIDKEQPNTLYDLNDRIY